MPTPPTVSIITPSYNHARFLEAAIQSVLQQDYRPIEYRVMDAGSTDGSLDVLRKYESHLRWTSQPDNGQADAINKGVAQTTGEIIGWLNSDDAYAPGALAAVADFFSSHPNVGVVYGNADFIDARGRRIGPCAHVEPFNASRLLHYSDFLVQPAAFFRRTVFDAVGGLDSTLNWALDYDFWLKASRVTPFAHIPRVLALYRWLDTSKTGIGGEARLAEVERVVKRYGATGLPAFFRLEAVRLHLLRAAADLRKGNLSPACSSFASAASAILLSPRAMLSLFSLRTWKIIWTGQILRRRAAALDLNPPTISA
jgi:hypothetical protein